MKRSFPWIITFSTWFYRCLLRLGPLEFRRAYEEQAIQDFRRFCREAYQQRGVLGVFQLWLPTLKETVPGMLAERRDMLPRPVRILLPVACMFLLVLFPFSWLSGLWPAFAAVFDRVFATSLAHEIGHVMLFCLTGLVMLCSLRKLRRRFMLYILLLMIGAFAEEAVQSLVYARLPSFDGHDLLLDFSGAVAAYILLNSWIWFKHFQTHDA